MNHMGNEFFFEGHQTDTDRAAVTSDRMTSVDRCLCWMMLDIDVAFLRAGQVQLRAL